MSSKSPEVSETPVSQNLDNPELAKKMLIPIPFSDKIEIGKFNVMKNVVKVPVTLAREMVQNYHRSELPEYLQSQILDNEEIVPILKPFSAIARAIESLDKLPITISDRHPKERFPKDGDFMIDGWVRDLKIDEKARSIKGIAYMPSSKVPVTLLDQIKAGLPVDVSIGGNVGFGGGGIHNGKKYMFAQRNIELGHLLVITAGKGRCPAPVCGLNIDKAPEDKDRLRNFSGNLKDGEVSQADPEIDPLTKTVIPKYSNENHSTTSNLKTTGAKKTMSDQDAVVKALQDENDKLKGTIADLQAKNATKEYEEIKTQLADANTVNDTLKSVNAKLTTDMEDYEKIKTELQGFKDKEMDTLREFIAANSDKKLEELKDICHHDLNVMASVIPKKPASALGDKHPGQGTFPKPNEKDRDPNKDKGPIGDAVVDMSETERQVLADRKAGLTEAS